MLPETGARTWGVKEREEEICNNETTTTIYSKLTASYIGTGSVLHVPSENSGLLEGMKAIKSAECGNPKGYYSYFTNTQN